MPTFLMFGKYSSEALRDMSAQRTEQAVDLIHKFGGEVDAMFAILGPYDLVFIVSFPGTEDAMKASVALSKLTGIGFSTAPAVAVQDFDELMGNV
jgi:uncharacterized protein with GYD domain